MQKNHFQDKRQRFSFRKLSVGLVSAIIGSFFMMSSLADTVDADQVDVSYRYVADSELTDEERKLVVSSLPDIAQATGDQYYLVYRLKKDTPSSLPKTGNASLTDLATVATGTVLLVVALYTGKKGRKKAMTFFLVSALGSQLVNPSVLALTNEVLAAYNQTFSVEVGQALPKPLTIDGYQYVGYLKLEKKQEPKEKVVIQNQDHQSTPNKDLKDDPSKKPAPQQEQIVKPASPDEKSEIKPSPESPKPVPSDENKNKKPSIEVPKTAPVSEDQPTAVIKTSDQTRVESIPFITERVENPDLAWGQEVISRVGQNGSRTIVTRTYSIEGEVLKTETLSDETLAPVSQIIQVGTKTEPEVPDPTPVPDEQPGTPDDPAPTPVPDEQPGTPDDPAPTPVPDGQPGTPDDPAPTPVPDEQPGTPDDPAPTPVPDGQPGTPDDPAPTPVPDEQPGTPDDPAPTPVPDKQPDNPEDKVPDPTVDDETVPPTIEVPKTAPVSEDQPTAVIKTSDQTKVESIPFTTERVENPDLAWGQEVISRVGQNGSRTIVTRTYSIEGEVLKTETVSDETLAPVSQIIQVGTRKEMAVPNKDLTNEEKEAKIETTDHKEVTVIPFTTKRVDNPDLKKGVEREIQKGKDGSRTVITRTYSVEGEVLKTETVSDETVDPTEQIIEVGQLIEKEKPTLIIENLVKDEDQKTVTATYRLEDPTNSYKMATAQVFKGDQIVKEVPIANPNGTLTIDGLDYYTDYVLKTNLDYTLNDGDHSGLEASVKDFDLPYKKIEFKDVDTVELFHKDGTSYRRQLNLETAPVDLDNYYVEIKSKRFKDMLLPVSSIVADGDQFKVTIAVDQLVQDNKGTTYDQNYSFTIPKLEPVMDSGVYTSFSKLVDAIRQDMAGTFVIGADLTADEVSLSDNATSYIQGDFIGSLKGTYQDKAYAIYNLKKPLFSSLKGATVSGLDLKEVAISSNEVAGALSSTSGNRTLITDVSVSGNLTGKKNLGGLVGNADMTKIENVTFKGSLAPSGSNDFYAGGIVGQISGYGFSHLKRAQVDIVLNIDAKRDGQKAGALAGVVNGGAWVADSYARGTVNNTGSSGQIGGLVGSTWHAGVISNLISDVKVIGGYASTGDQYGGVDARNIRISQSVTATRSPEKFASTITDEEAMALREGLGITASLDDSGQSQKRNEHRTNYLTLPNVHENRLMAYQNMEKLLPFYNKETLVYYGNKVNPDSPLAKVALLDVVPMVGDQVVIAPVLDKERINKLMLHYADGNLVYQDVAFKGDFKNKQVAEYSLLGTDLIYTPENFIGDYQPITSQVLPILQGIEFDSEAVRTTLGISADASLDALYLDRGFEATKNQLATELVKALSADKGINTLGPSVLDATTQKLKENATAFLLGLSYLNRWYNIQFGDLNAKDLNSYKFDFFGNQTASTLDTIIHLGKSGFDNLKPANNLNTYTTSLATATGKANLYDYLESQRKLFLPQKTNNEWLKENSKAYIVEQPSGITEVALRQEKAQPKDKEALGVYDRLTQPDWEYRNMLLPLLSLPEKGVFVISTMSTLSFGTYDRYKDKDSTNTVRLGEALNSYVEAKVDQAALWQRDHFDFWYHVLPADIRERLFRKFLNYDGFWIKDDNGNQYWAELSDKRSSSIHDFFGPVGKHYGANGSGAYATGYVTHFVVDRMLDQYGTSVFTHEMTHNFDGGIYFEGYGRREGQGAENYAFGMLQSADNVNSSGLILNTVFKGDKESLSRYQVYDPAERFKSAADLQAYSKGSMDLLYLMDYLEGDAVVQQSDEVKQKWFRKIENYYEQDAKTHQNTHAGNDIRRLTDEEVQRLRTFNDLVDNDIMNRREYPDTAHLKRNGYYMNNLFSPVYAGLSNPHGSPGDFMFRRMAFELLADKGYQEGFLPYVSNMLAAQALADGEVTFSGWFGRNVGLVTDTRVLHHIYGDQYQSWADFKKDKFRESVEKAKVSLRPITIRYELGRPNSEQTVTITNFYQLKELMRQAVEKDVEIVDRSTTHTPASWVHLLKSKIYNAYLRDTDDFRSTIFDQ